MTRKACLVTSIEQAFPALYDSLGKHRSPLYISLWMQSKFQFLSRPAMQTHAPTERADRNSSKKGSEADDAIILLICKQRVF